MIYREQTPADVPMAFLIRAAARENPMPLISGLKFLGITVEGEARKLATTHKGFVCEDDGLVVGFVIADGGTGANFGCYRFGPNTRARASVASL